MPTAMPISPANGRLGSVLLLAWVQASHMFDMPPLLHTPPNYATMCHSASENPSKCRKKHYGHYRGTVMNVQPRA